MAVQVDSRPLLSVDRERLSRLLDQQSATPLSICTERARLFTDSMRRTEGMPQILRMALALQHVLEHGTIFIGNDELIVGNVSARPGGKPFFPENGWAPHFEAVLAKEEGLAEVLAYWKDRPVPEVVSSICPAEVRRRRGDGDH